MQEMIRAMNIISEKVQRIYKIVKTIEGYRIPDEYPGVKCFCGGGKGR